MPAHKKPLQKCIDEYDKFLQEIGFTIAMTLLEFEQTRKVSFMCKQGHIHTLGKTPFENKVLSVQRKELEPFKFCRTCKKEYDNRLKREREINHLQQKLRKKGSTHTIIEYVHSHNLLYKCGNCKSICRSEKQNLLKSSNLSQCANCQHSFQRLPIEEVKRRVEAMNFILFMTEQEYTTNKSVKVLCPCGSIWVAALHDIKRGRNCTRCKARKTIETNQLLYGVNNVFQSQQIKDIIKERYGNECAMRCPKIFEKSCKNNPIHNILSYTYTDNSKTYTWDVMGYELFAIDYLLNNIKIHPTDIVTEDGNSRKIIHYNCGRQGCKDNCLKDTTNKPHVYYPDIYIKSQKRFIEVKSKYTLLNRSRNLDQKLQAVKDQGYMIDVWVFNKDGQLVEQH